MKFIPLLVAAYITGCAVTTPPPDLEVKPVATKPPGIVVCMNAGLAEKAKAQRAAPGVLLIVVYGDYPITGEANVWPDGTDWWMPAGELVRFFEAMHPDRVLSIVVYDMPLLAAGDGHGWLHPGKRLGYGQGVPEVRIRPVAG